MTRPFFNRDRISDFDNFERNASQAISKMQQRLNEGHAVDFQVHATLPLLLTIFTVLHQDLITRFTLDSASEFLFGFNLESLSAGLPYPASSPLANAPNFVEHPSDAFVKAFSTGLQQLAKRGRVGNIWPLLEFWKDEAKEQREILDKFLQPFVDAEFARKKTGPTHEKVEEGQTLLSSLVQFTDGQLDILAHINTSTDKGFADSVLIRDELLNILLAGRDTVSVLCLVVLLCSCLTC
jgi:hypothetical protein